MGSRFTYSRWDGTQKGFDLDAEGLFGELTDDLLYHGDVNAALRRMMQEGMRDRNGDRVQGLRELMEKLRQQRQDTLDQFDLGGVYDEIASELNDIVDEERHAVEQATDAAERSGDERRANTARDAAAERNFRLDMLPNDLAGKVRELSAYDFESGEAQQRFEQLMEKLKQQLTQQMVDKMSGAMQNMSPQDMARMKDMMASLNDLIEQRQAGAHPDDEQQAFEQFMQQFGDFFPENPQNLDELLQQMAQRMAAMQAMMNSMTPEQRAQLQQLSDQLLDDMDLRWQMDQLGRNLQGMFPQEGWGQSYEFQGDEGMGMGQAMQTMQELGDLDQLEQLLRNATSPAQLAEADLDRVREVAVEPKGSGGGAVAGGVVGGIIGNQIGKGATRDIATILGAVGGAYAGNHIEKTVKEAKRYDVIVRFEDGSTRTFSSDTPPAWQSGDRVRLQSGGLVAGNNRSGGSSGVI